jgi:hypothetical protein
MEVVEGTIGQIAMRNMEADSGRAALSAIEVGHRQLRRVMLTEPLSQALESGKFARVLVWRGLTQGLVTRPFVAAVEVDGKTYKSHRVLRMTLVKILLWMILVVGIGSVSPVLGVFVAACIIGFYAKNCLDFMRFGNH